MAPRRHTAESASEPDPLELVERLGVGKVAQAFGISHQAVRRYRVRGVPKDREHALIELARAEGVLPPDDDVAPAVDRVSTAADQVASSKGSVAERGKSVATNEVPVAQPDETSSRRRTIESGRSKRHAGHASLGMHGRIKPVRLNRRTVLIVGTGLVAALALGLSQGLRGLGGSTATSQAQESAQALVYQPPPANALPTYSYTDLPQPAAVSERDEPSVAAELLATDPPTTPAADLFVSDRRAQEEEEALRSSLFPAGALALRSQVTAAGQQRSQLSARDQLATSFPTPQDLFPGNQPSAAEQREAFLNRQLDQRIYLQNGLQRPFSDYEVKAGTIIPAALITGLNSDLPGEIIGQVTEHVYDTATGRHLLIPQGARIFGRYNAQVGYAQDRVQIVWDRLIMPNGNSVQLEAMVGTDKAGFAGLTDQVDHHLGRLYGAVILSSIISAGANLATDSGGDNGFTDSLGNAAAQQAVTIGGKLVDRQLDVQPTITVRPGFKLNILVNKHMILEPYGRGSRRF